MKYHKQLLLNLVLLSFLAILGTSCGASEGKQKKKEEAKKITVPTKRYDLYAINGVMSLPDYYKRVDFDEWRKMIKDANPAALDRARGLERVSYIQKTFPKYNLFLDKTNYKNSVVLIQLDDYVTVSEEVGTVLVKKISRDFRDMFRYNGMKAKQMQAQKSKIGFSEYIKVRYYISSESSGYFTTCYLFSSEGKSFMIWVEQQEDTDFEEYIETLLVD